MLALWFKDNFFNCVYAVGLSVRCHSKWMENLYDRANGQKLIKITLCPPWGFVLKLSSLNTNVLWNIFVDSWMSRLPCPKENH